MRDVIHKYPSQEADRFQVRMPDGLRDRLREAAAANGRSMNSEIVARLEASFDQIGSRHPGLDEAIAAHGGDVKALLASEALRLRQLLERLER